MAKLHNIVKSMTGRELRMTELKEVILKLRAQEKNSHQLTSSGAGYKGTRFTVKFRLEENE